MSRQTQIRGKEIRDGTLHTDAVTLTIHAIQTVLEETRDEVCIDKDCRIVVQKTEEKGRIRGI